MPRLPLIHIPNGIYSVVSKCNNDEFHFNADEKFETYLQHLLWCKRHFGFRLHDVCCMSNHVHEMYVVPERYTIADILKRVKGCFSVRYNAKYGRSGHFWRNKPFYRIVQDERYLVYSAVYYHQNPVKAGMVKAPDEWPYSGYRFHVLGERKGILGDLLDPIPDVLPEDWVEIEPKQYQEVSQLLQQPRKRFVGDPEFRCTMANRYKGVVSKG